METNTDTQIKTEIPEGTKNIPDNRIAVRSLESKINSPEHHQRFKATYGDTYRELGTDWQSKLDILKEYYEAHNIPFPKLNQKN